MVIQIVIQCHNVNAEIVFFADFSRPLLQIRPLLVGKQPGIVRHMGSAGGNHEAVYNQQNQNEAYKIPFFHVTPPYSISSKVSPAAARKEPPIHSASFSLSMGKSPISLPV